MSGILSWLAFSMCIYVGKLLALPVFDKLTMTSFLNNCKSNCNKRGRIVTVSDTTFGSIVSNRACGGFHCHGSTSSP